MRIFILGGSGVIGRRLVPLLVAAQHEVGAMTRSTEKIDMLRKLGSTPILCDVYQPQQLEKVMTDFHPDVVIQQLTDLPDDVGMLAEYGARNDRMRREGTRNVLRAAEAGQVSRVFVQSIAWRLPDDRGAAVSEMEELVLKADGRVLRYGRLYGPDTFYQADKPDPPRIQVDEAARRTIPALDAAPGQLVSIVE
jgi:nucleoside-diphosphate-sugar epimerase